MAFNGLGMHLGSLALLSDADSRSLSAENPTGAKGSGGTASEGLGAEAAADLGLGWKVSPAVSIKAGETIEIGNIEGPGAIQQIWMTPTGPFRMLVLRIYWDGQDHPSVECPLGDFFATAWNTYAPIVSLPVCVNPQAGFNCYWEMPFRGNCRITLQNVSTADAVLFYQINYSLTDIPDNAAYFHAQFRRANPLPYGEVYPILDGLEGRGQYVGTHVGWGVNSNGWWGEGELKFFLDGDGEFPTICGTGTEDYFCGAWGFGVDGRYTSFTTPYSGMPLVVTPDSSDLTKTQTRFGLYRWHIPDPIRFGNRLRVTMQALGWRANKRYLPLQDDISSVAYWYQTLPTTPFPPFPPSQVLEIV